MAEKKGGDRRSHPVYTDDFDAILAQNQKRNPRPLSVDEMVQALTRGENRAAVRLLARRYAAKLGISEEDFIIKAGRRG